MRSQPQFDVAKLIFLFVVSLGLAACGQSQAASDGIELAWANSAHGNVEAVAFTRWNDDDPAVIPENCAKCHSTAGYHDYLGLDGSTPGMVDQPAPVGTTVECDACHNDLSKEQHSSIMPSGIELMDLGKEATCMDCHQGRHSTVSVNEALLDLEDNTVNEELSFLNIHNGASGPTQYGTEAKGGYEYDGRTYVGFYEHVVGFETCTACHNPHSLEVPADSCSTCHLGAGTEEGRQQLRTSNIDYDGDGNVTEGMAEEIDTMRERLLLTIQLYAAITEGLDDIVYEDSNPYFFDSEGEPYATWTPRLLRAAYNYQYTTKDTGGFAHNGKYHVQLMYDSLNDLGADTSAMTRP